MAITEERVTQQGVGLQSSVGELPQGQVHAKNSGSRGTFERDTTVFVPNKVSGRGEGTRPQACMHPVHQLRVMFPAQDFVTHHRFQIAHCAACGFDITSPQPGVGDIASYYPTGYYGDPGDRRFPWVVEALQRLLYSHRVRMVESVHRGQGGRVLDVGCGRGELLAAFRRKGWQVHGTELSDEAARYARGVANVPVSIGPLEEIRFPDHHFDAVAMWHVLEHVHHPRAVLAEVSRILKPNGVLLVGVPNIGSLEARLFRDKWFHLDVPRHMTHLTRSSLKEALNASGLEDRSWSGFAAEYDVFSFVQSTLNKCGLRHNLLYNILRGKDAKVIEGDRVPKWQVVASVLFGAALGVISLPATVCAGLLGQSGTLTALAVKRDTRQSANR